MTEISFKKTKSFIIFSFVSKDIPSDIPKPEFVSKTIFTNSDSFMFDFYYPINNIPDYISNLINK